MSVSIISIFTNWCQVLALQQRLQFKKVLNGFPNGRSIGGVKFAVIVRCEWNFLQLTHLGLDSADSRLKGKWECKQGSEGLADTQ